MTAEKDVALTESCTKTLRIRWQRLLTDGKTCPRCDSTGKELEKAVSVLEQSLAPLKINVIFKKEELSQAEFKKDPLVSNRISINGKSLEDWVGGKTGQSACCDVCGDSDCRTIGVGGVVYETIPGDLVIKAGLLASAQLLCGDKQPPEAPASGCCPK